MGAFAAERGVRFTPTFFEMSDETNSSRSYETAELAIADGASLHGLVSAYRAFVWVRILRARHVELSEANKDWLAKAREQHESGSYEQGAEGELYSSLWHSLLYTLVETWRGNNLTSPKINAMIADPRIQVLRKFRNATLHPIDFSDPRIQQLRRQGEEGYEFYISLLAEFEAYFEFMIRKDRESRKSFLSGS
jgi:hypothetical protein